MTYRNPPSRRDKWKTRVLKTPTLSHGTRLFLVHTLAKHMKADGFVCHPRKKLAWEANLSERQVTRYMGKAVDAGWLVVLQPGYRTMTAEYQAVFPTPNSGTQDVSLSEPEKGDANKPSFGVTNTSRFPVEKGDIGRPTTSSSTTRPLRVVRDRTNAQSATAPSSMRLSSLTARQQNRTVWLSPRHSGSLQPGRCQGRPGGATRLAVVGSAKSNRGRASVTGGSKSKSAAKGGVA